MCRLISAMNAALFDGQSAANMRLTPWFVDSKPHVMKGFTHTQNATGITNFIQQILAAWSPPFMNGSMNNSAGGHGSAQPVIKKN